MTRWILYCLLKDGGLCKKASRSQWISSCVKKYDTRFPDVAASEMKDYVSQCMLSEEATAEQE